MKFKLINIVFTLFLFSFTNCESKLVNGNYFEKIGNYKLNYSILGNGSEVMIIGHPNSGKIGYELTLKPLEEKFKTIYYEPRGTGKSEIPKNIEEYNQDYSVQEIEDLRKKIKADRIWLFGHSDQSAIALIYALKFPQHTKGIILSGTSFVGTQEESIQRRKSTETKRAKESRWFLNVLNEWDYMINNKTKIDKNGKNISDAPIKWWCYNEKSARKVIEIAHKIKEQGRRKSIDNKYYVESSEEREKYLDYQKEFSKIKSPILIINGKYDTNNPPEFAKQLHKKLSNSTLILVDKAGHFPWVENRKETFTEINNWLIKTSKQ